MNELNALGYVVTLEESLDGQEARATLAALGQIRGVLRVSPVLATPVDEEILGLRVRRELGEKLYAALYPPSEYPWMKKTDE